MWFSEFSFAQKFVFCLYINSVINMFENSGNVNKFINASFNNLLETKKIFQSL